MNILLTGDSWGLGVFANVNNEYGPIGQGIENLLQDKGHTVVNISCAGGSNWLMIDRLEGRWDRSDKCIFGVNPQDKKHFDLDKIDLIIFLQTDIFRERSYYVLEKVGGASFDWKVLEQQFVESLLKYNSIDDFSNQYFDSLYQKLNSFNKTVLCIGGWAKLHPAIEKFDNLVPIIYSATKLLIPDLVEDFYISDKEWFLQLDQNTKIMEKFGHEVKTLAIANADKLDQMINHWQDVHPNLDGYVKIVEYLEPYLHKKIEKNC